MATKEPTSMTDVFEAEEVIETDEALQRQIKDRAREIAQGMNRRDAEAAAEMHVKKEDAAG